MDYKKIPSEFYDDLFITKFKHGGRGPSEYDCYGLVIEVLFRMGIKLLDVNSYEERSNYLTLLKNNKLVSKLENPEVGALIVFKSVKFAYHIGICLDDKEFLEISQVHGVRVVKLNKYISSTCKGFYKCLN